MSREVNCLSPPFPARASLSPAFAAAASSFVSEGFARLRGVWAGVGGRGWVRGERLCWCGCGWTVDMYVSVCVLVGVWVYVWLRVGMYICTGW